MAAVRGEVVPREGAASGCDPAGGCGVPSAADTEERAEGQHCLKPPLRERVAPPPRRPAHGRRLPGTTPGAPLAAPHVAPLGAHALPSIAVQGDAESASAQPPDEAGGPGEVERLNAENRTLKASLAAAEALVAELRAALAAATAQAQPADPAPAAQPADGGQQEQKVPNGKRRNRTRQRKRNRRQRPEPEEMEDEAQEPEGPACEEGQGDDAAAAGADPAPRPEQLGEQGIEEQVAARPPTPWADEWESQEEPEAPPPRASQRTALASPPSGLSGSTRTAVPTPAAEAWICCSCGVVNYHASPFCGSPQCGRERFGAEDHSVPVQFPVGQEYACPEAGSWHVAPAEVLGMEQQEHYQQQVGIAPQCAADFTPAPPPQRQPPPRRIYSQPVPLPMLVPIAQPNPLPVPEPADPRMAIGDALHPRVVELCPARAEKITGMLLVLGSSYAQRLLTDPHLLASEVEEAWQALVTSERPRCTQLAAPAPAQAPAPPCGQQAVPNKPCKAYVPSYLRRQCGQPAAPAPAPAPAPPPPRGQQGPYMPPYARRRQRL
eukprot:TRINITY_DN20061_c0_g1_i1.p1 TRINITY_DN20061_c0_g1~~TRINITY_DN20061_c0_g1_i1.p1  ORF type:complete len:550 (+),score=104.65 TRINITY_DN20061_c0_g1_i1:78-1727(+)